MILFDILTIILGGSIVLFAAIIFTNAIEYIGYKKDWSGSFVGALLAPLVTSFPELTVFLVAVFAYGGSSGEEIGIGTLYGQPFMASSLSYGLVGIVAIIAYHLHKRDDLVFEVEKELEFPYAFITVLFPLTLVPAIINYHLVKIGFGFIFLGSYVFYMYLMYTRRSLELLEEEEANRPYLEKYLHHDIASAIIQLIVSVILLYYGSEILVSSVDHLASGLGIDPFAISLIAIPAVTALPETASAIVWGYRGRDTLSIGSLVGEKVLYSTFYPGLGLLLTNWPFNIHAVLSVIATTVISVILLIYIMKQRIPWYALLVGFIFFVSYAYIVLLLHF